MLSHAGAEFRAIPGYLNTAAQGLLPARTLTALEQALAGLATGELEGVDYERAVDESRAAFAALVSVDPTRVALGDTVSRHVGLVAAALPAGSEVLCAEGEFSSVVTAFALRPELRLRQVPLAGLVDAVGPGTALVAVSSVQSADGARADLAGLAAAARAHGALTLVDTTQSTGWLPLSADAFDFTVCSAYKWLLCPRGTAFLTVPADGGGLVPPGPGWAAAAHPDRALYGPITELAPDARRFDPNPTVLNFVAAAQSLALVRELGQDRIGAHDLRLADLFRRGLAELGLTPVPGDSPIVSLPETDRAVAALTAAGVRFSARAGRLRFAFHLYNTEDDVDLALTALA
ncbi:aminotransferase class V-fold PLP-dependent enzyme [Streptomyces sp. DSM 44915]|uniref:Aminotransferase class V-fold PLP-dependent enzyme n=1 Tax=Streptomyces chisholmiae TaxID=3075540 RepID=A0ABU2JZH3_9ACTN|nr:aminotransferase class V-fold PLP-dependent enzyme [Streptomyces sp. DSM 44915]MDT0269603.1 aminotransferase class V-fold PLP-dependent enzyme [Streptomyces sp. DSM 44915]